ncbi:acyltransferase [Polynucleobacter paneuropaeus]|jgi:galactoside O-acetyltransferase|nr:acyltransferase [Polynucleobacter paneuropaeus]
MGNFLNQEQIQGLGFASIGSNVYISSRASFYNCSQISIGSNVRIDDFCVISSGKRGVNIGSNIHIGVSSTLIGAGRITLSDFCNISSKVSIYSSNDDYSGETMSNPMVPEMYKNVNNDDVYIGRHVIVGCSSVILPGIVIEDGAVIGALSLVKKNCSYFGIYAGSPAKYIKERSRKLLDLETHFLDYYDSKK